MCHAETAYRLESIHEEASAFMAMETALQSCESPEGQQLIADNRARQRWVELWRSDHIGMQENIWAYGRSALRWGDDARGARLRLDEYYTRSAARKRVLAEVRAELLEHCRSEHIIDGLPIEAWQSAFADMLNSFGLDAQPMLPRCSDEILD
jgi:hypothetical protein